MSAAAARPAETGLPGPLPEGESVLWQGGPDAVAVAKRILHVRSLAAYFVLLALVVALRGWTEGRSGAALATSLAVVAAAAVATLAIAAGLAVLIARTTRYTITNRRVVMRFGIALPITLNVPFAIVGNADVRRFRDGTGDFPLALTGSGRIGFLHLWPHARPWRLARPEPMLRAVPDAAQVAAILARALGGGELGRAASLRDETRRAAAAAAPVAA